MKRLLLGLSIASGVALAGVFALTQAKRGGALGADGDPGGASPKTGGAGEPWVQPMPKTLTANSVSDAVGGDAFTAPLTGPRSTDAAGRGATVQNQASPGSGVRFQNVNTQRLIDEQGAGGSGPSATNDPFAGLAPPMDSKGAAAAPRGNGVAANETSTANIRGNDVRLSGATPPPLPLPSDAASKPGAFASGGANPLRAESASGGGKPPEFYDSSSSPPGGPSPGARAFSQNDASAVGSRQLAPEPGAFPPAAFGNDGAAVGQAKTPDPRTAERGGVPSSGLDQGFRNGSPGSGGNDGLGGSRGRPFAGQLASASVREGAALPGGKQLEGNQLPTLAIQKFAPPEIQVNKPAVFEIHVRNTGPVTAREVVIQDRVPQGAQFVRSTPDAVPTPSGDLEWRFDALPPRDQRVIKVELRPLKRGDIGSVATVRFSADASARSKCTCPDLRVEVAAARQTLIGDALALTIAVANMGDGPATGVVVAEQLPDKFEHAQGQLLENELGTLKPGESRQLKLTLKAARPGMGVNRVAVRAEGEQRVEKQLELEVVAPALDLQVQGPPHQFLQREAVYAIQLQNPGTAPAKKVRLSALVPAGFRFLAANNYGEFDAKAGRVNWELVELPAGQKDRVEMKLLAIEPGAHQLQVEARGQRNVQAARAHQVAVEGVAAVGFEVVQKGNALEIGAEKVYEIKVRNDGTSEATHVYVSAEVPAGLQPLGGNGPLQATVNGNKVVFGPLPKLAPRADTSFFVHVRAQAPGDHLIRFQVGSAELKAPTSKEEVLRVR